MRDVLKAFKDYNQEFLDQFEIVKNFNDDEEFLNSNIISVSNYLIKYIKFLGFDISHTADAITVKKNDHYFTTSLKSRKDFERDIIINDTSRYILEHFRSKKQLYDKKTTEIALKEYKETNMSLFDIDFHQDSISINDINDVISYFFTLTDNKLPLLLLKSKHNRGLHIYCLTNSFKETKKNFEYYIKKSLMEFSNKITGVDIRSSHQIRLPYLTDYVSLNPENREKESLLDTLNRLHKNITECNKNYLFDIYKYLPKKEKGFDSFYSDRNIKDLNKDDKVFNDYLVINKSEKQKKVFGFCFSQIKQGYNFNEFMYNLYQANQGSEDIEKWLGKNSYSPSIDGEKELKNIWDWCNKNYVELKTSNIEQNYKFLKYDFSNINIYVVTKIIEKEFSKPIEKKHHEFLVKALCFVIHIYLYDKKNPKKINLNFNKKNLYNRGIQISRKTQLDFKKEFGLKANAPKKFNMLLLNSNLFVQYKPNKLGWVYGKNVKGVCRQFIPKLSLLKKVLNVR